MMDEGCRFTEYSVSSSVLPRNEGLTMLDDKFEQMFAQYDEVGQSYYNFLNLQL